MSTTTTTISPTGVAASDAVVGTLRLRTPAELIDMHSAAEQAGAPSELRSDRNYIEPYEGPQPEWWPTGRGVPLFRPLNRNQDITHRPWANTPVEVAFVRTMLSGVLVIGMVNRTWRSTIGKIKSDLWVYPVGGYF